WKVLIVDDEQDVHDVTRLSTKNLVFDGKKIQFLHAFSAKEAQNILLEEPNIAVALIDVVMETDHAGLELVKCIRQEFKNHHIRLIIRTGQPGIAPEKYIIDEYDIDDYKEKTDMIAQKLYTTIRAAIKSYRDILTIHRNRAGLEKILIAAPELYALKPLEIFFEGILIQVASICNFGSNSLMSTLNGFLARNEDGNHINILACTGKFSSIANTELEHRVKILKTRIQNQEYGLDDHGNLLLPLTINNQTEAFIFFEEINTTIGSDELQLISIMANQCASALNNVRLYDELQKANEHNKMKNLFLGMAAHDLRNPIGFISSYSDLFINRSRSKLSEHELSMISRMKQASQIALNIINNLLDYAKIESGNIDLEISPTQLYDVVSQAIVHNQTYADSKQVILENQCRPTFQHIMIDPIRFQQVISNLINNAIKYSHPQTRVVIVANQTEDHTLRISVHDQGQGISEHDITLLFKPFGKTQTKSTSGEISTGLGLVICRKIVEAHKGTIWVESKLGVGSTFYIEIPIS
ncbi:MAG: DUF3369 domain-containing protein, partial [Desulfobacterales bacterium]|nr:DUF3369 domain-containing protein [Desulfobacterales bacterium]